MSKLKDRKITVSVREELAAAVDNYVQEQGNATNRSKVIDKAIELWNVLHQHGEPDEILEAALNLYRREQERELYRSYYANLSTEAKEEAAGWRQLGEDTAASQWQ
jgi:metal-responsive CopG/Arc/MetJ family transcriptional regulator